MSRAEVNKLYDEYRPRLATHVSEYGDKLKALPPVTPTRKSGLRWIERFDNEDKWLECPHCHKDSDNAYTYCPNCGASFKEEKRNNKPKTYIDCQKCENFRNPDYSKCIECEK